MKKIVRWDKRKIAEYWKIMQEDPISHLFFMETGSTTEWLLNRAKKYLRKSLNSNILDIGCGSMRLLKELALNNFTSLYGVDASLKASNKTSSIQGICGDIESLPLRDESMHIIFATEVLEHLADEDLVKCVQEVYRVLSWGGRFIIAVPYKEHLSLVLCPDCHAIFTPTQHLRSFDENSMSRLLTAFKVVKITPSSRMGTGKRGKLAKLILLTVKLLEPILRRLNRASEMFVVAEK